MYDFDYDFLIIWTMMTSVFKLTSVFISILVYVCNKRLALRIVHLGLIIIMQGR